MSTPNPDDATVPLTHPPELGGLDPQELFNAALHTVPPPSMPGQGTSDLPLPEELSALLPVGTYQVDRFLGQGGMGAVYRGTQIRLQRPVAIKIMRRDQGRDHGFEQRFQREALSMAKLNHPNIVNVIDYGEAGPDYLYIVMELVDGADLMDVIRTGRMTQEMALTLLPQICDALQFAHDHGIVHRDIKPSNIMLTRDGCIKMADFGLAKLVDMESTFHTQTGTGLGTPDYAAPEQFVEHGPIDHRADIYALGVMIYQMITGTLPRGVWKPPSQRAEVDEQWDEIVSHAMQNDPADRYQHAVDIKNDVSRITPGGKIAAPGTPAPAVTPRQTAKVAASRKVMMVLTIVSLAAFVMAGVWSRTFSGKLANGTAAPVLAGSSPAALSVQAGIPSLAATKDKPFVNTLGMKFVPVPIVGGPTDKQRVLFSVWDTRVRDYAAYAAANPNVDGMWKRAQKDGVPVGREPEHPVVNVNSEDAQAFCQWLTITETAAGKLPQGARYRLPTDVEWSQAAGLPPEAGSTPSERHRQNAPGYPWGSQWPPARKVGNYADDTFHAIYHTRPDDLKHWMQGYEDAFQTTSPVGSFPANENGLYDMGGNVWQWCEDPWSAQQPANRAMRGASWSDGDPDWVRSAFRKMIGLTNRDVYYGFRCVLEPATAPTPSPSAQAVSGTPAIATNVRPFTNTLGMKFVLVPGTDVLFCIHETRCRDYGAYAGAGTKMSDQAKSSALGQAKSTPDNPATYVNWEDAQAFCAWLSRKEGKTYRLPTDREWSFAVGVGDQEKWNADTTPTSVNKVPDQFPWGTAWPPPKGAGNYRDETFHAKFPPKPGEKEDPWIEGYDDGFVDPAPVMSFAPNRLGIYDLGGNVWEWVADWFDGSQQKRTLRGAGNSAGPRSNRNDLLSSNRIALPPGGTNSGWGFRVVLNDAAANQPQ